MADSKDEKTQAQKIHDRVMNAPVWNVLSRMRWLGFWPKTADLPPDPPDEVKERAALEEKKKGLLAQAYASEAQLNAALEVERKRRIDESRKKRAERIEQRAKAATERRLAWARERAKRIVHAGVGVSAGLEGVVSDAGKLLQRGLPVLNDGADLARVLKLSLGELRFLTFHRRGAAVVHYHRFSIPKKTGGVRLISAPKKKLKTAQAWVHASILKPVTDAAAVGPHAHGFVPGRNVVSNAAPHTGKRVVINLDLNDFFPSVTFRRVKGLYRGLGYSEHVATLLALLCTEPPRAPVVVDGKRVYIALGERSLPQGACTSPALTNLLCRRLDKRLAGVAAKYGFAYTRYADDLTFSGDDDARLQHLMRLVRDVLADEGLTEHPDKTHVMRRGRRQEVTGVVVNQRPAVVRSEVRQLRAILHRARFEGLPAQNRGRVAGDFVAHIRGRIAWVQMVDRQKGDRLRADFDRLFAAAPATSTSTATPSTSAAPGLRLTLPNPDDDG
jgi:RNA-directed DNA polymerase